MRLFGNLDFDSRHLFREPVPAVVGAVAAAAIAGGGALLAARVLGAGGKVGTVAAVAAALGGAVAGAIGGALLGIRIASGAAAHAAAGVDELRVVTINIHQAVPKGYELGDRNERIGVLADVARYVRDIDADVVFVQEVDDDVAAPGKQGVTGQLRALNDLMGASDFVYSPARAEQDPSLYGLTADRDRYGIAMFSRNGIELEDATHVSLVHGEGMEPRQLLSAVAVLPDGRRITAVDTHLDHTGIDRPAQLAEVGRRLAAVRGPLVVGGDFNATKDIVDPELAPSGLANVIDSDFARGLRGTSAGAAAMAPSYLDTRIDHIYARSDTPVADTWVEEIPMHDTWLAYAVSDHRAVVADLLLPRTEG